MSLTCTFMIHVHIYIDLGSLVTPSLPRSPSITFIHTNVLGCLLHNITQQFTLVTYMYLNSHEVTSILQIKTKRNPQKWHKLASVLQRKTERNPQNQCFGMIEAGCSPMKLVHRMGCPKSTITRLTSTCTYIHTIFIYTQFVHI